jgi:hypothetical protein
MDNQINVMYCDCGQVFFVGQPLAKQEMDRIANGSREEFNIQVVVLGDDFINCQSCGEGHTVPPAEFFDLDRQEPGED